MIKTKVGHLQVNCCTEVRVQRYKISIDIIYNLSNIYYIEYVIYTMCGTEVVAKCKYVTFRSFWCDYVDMLLKYYIISN